MGIWKKLSSCLGTQIWNFLHILSYKPHIAYGTYLYYKGVRYDLNINKDDFSGVNVDFIGNAPGKETL